MERREADPPLPPGDAGADGSPQVFDVTHLIGFYYGATWSLDRKALFDWKDEEPGDFEKKVQAVLRAERFLGCCASRSSSSRGTTSSRRSSCASTRCEPSRSVLERALDPDKRRGLVWHTQGSGKTLHDDHRRRAALEDRALREPDGAACSWTATSWRASSSRNLEAVGIGDVEGRREQAATCSELLRSDYRGPDRLDDPQVRRACPPNLSTRDERLRAGRRGAPHHRRRPRQLPDGRAAQRHLHRLHRHADRQDAPRQGHVQDLRHRRRRRATSTSTRSASRSRTARRCRSTTRWRRTSCAWTARRSKRSSWRWPRRRASPTSRN